MMLRDLEDQVIRDTLPEVKTGMKWSAREEVEAMECHLQHKDIVGATQSGRAGLGMQKHAYFYRASSYEKRKLVADEIRASSWSCATGNMDKMGIHRSKVTVME